MTKKKDKKEELIEEISQNRIGVFALLSAFTGITVAVLIWAGWL